MVKVYSRQSCQPCKALKYWLQKNNIEFWEIDVDEKPEEFAKTGSKMVPTVEINDHLIIGLNYGAMKDFLEES